MRSDYKRVVSWGCLRWLPAIPLIILLIFGSGSVALVQASPAPSDTLSQISADYQPWEFTVFKPVDIEIIEEIQRDQVLYPEVFEEPVQPLAAAGSFWDPIAAPILTSPTPTPTQIAVSTETVAPVSPTVSETLTATASPSASLSPSPTATFTPSGPPAPIPAGVPPANTYWFYEDTSPLSHMMYTTLASGSYSSGGTADLTPDLCTTC